MVSLFFYNDVEGGNVPLEGYGLQHFERQDAHVGQAVIIIHVNGRLITTKDDLKLVGFLEMEFPIYGRKCVFRRSIHLI